MAKGSSPLVLNIILENKNKTSRKVSKYKKLTPPQSSSTKTPFYMNQFITVKVFRKRPNPYTHPSRLPLNISPPIRSLRKFFSVACLQKQNFLIRCRCSKGMTKKKVRKKAKASSFKNFVKRVIRFAMELFLSEIPIFHSQ